MKYHKALWQSLSALAVMAVFFLHCFFIWIINIRHRLLMGNLGS